MEKITPVILCGGSGTRLWPLSRKSHPKQFTQLLGDKTLFQAAVQRFSDDSQFGPAIAVTGSDFRFVVTEQMEAIGAQPLTVLVEPLPRNTAPAVLAAALWMYEQDPDAVILIAPSDHLIPDAADFRKAVTSGLDAVRRGKIVTFGVAPDKPETGYGYLELADGDLHVSGAVDLIAFVEKPGPEQALQMVESKRYLWNAGIFLARVGDLIAAFEALAPEIVDPVQKSVKQAKTDLNFLRLEEASFATAPSISLDYAVMEKASNLAVVPYSGAWSDLGDWRAVWAAQEIDDSGVALSGPAMAIDCRETLLRSEAPGQVVVGLGLDNIIAVAMPDAVLVTRRDRAQDVRQVVDLLKAEGKSQAETLPRDYRPWGWYETLALGRRFQVKRIVVNPGAALSLQSHHHRAEHWVVVEGTARVTVDDSVRLVTENQSVYIPLGATHRMENPGKVQMVLIEVQTGAYLGEDDIVRYDDVYSRGQGAKG